MPILAQVIQAAIQSSHGFGAGGLACLEGRSPRLPPGAPVRGGPGPYAGGASGGGGGQTGLGHLPPQGRG